MRKKGDCWDHAVAESFFKSLKNEWLNHVTFYNRKQAKMVAFEYIEIWYNNQRIHASIGYKSPKKFNRQLEVNAKAA